MNDPNSPGEILRRHVHVGRSKPVTYLPLSTIENVLEMPLEEYVRMVEQAGGKCSVFSESETCIRSGAA
jgi:hypothetical protein